jgi:isochorismate synthase
MQVFTEIQTLLLHQKPFVCYIKPNATVWNLLVQDNEASIEFSGQNGFVFVPFQDGKKVVIPFEENAFLQGNLEDLAKEPVTQFQTNNLQQTDFENLVSKGVSAIKQGHFDKVVVSRKLSIPGHFSIVASFKNIVYGYPTAFRYLFVHPKIGIWMGATPEQLVKINKDQYETVALAGTKLYSDGLDWTTKEVNEQKIVTDYIVSKIKNHVNDLALSEPQTIQAGNLAHLKSVITGQLTSKFSALDLITTLHPTPAVCGLPKAAATEFIVKNEHYHRSYYAGFLGEYNTAESTDLFVNLRCLQWEENAVHIYVGCGITADSDPNLEYIETENKSMTMRDILVKVKS